jgi:hypothetical protein
MLVASALARVHSLASVGPQALSASMAYRFLKLLPDTVLAKHLLNLLTYAVAAQKPTYAVVV